MGPLPVCAGASGSVEPMNISHIGGTAVATLLAAALLAGCGSSSSGSTADSTAGASTDQMLTTGVAVCDAAAIGKAVDAVGASQKTTAVLNPGGFKCADGWAYAYADLGPGAEAVTVTLVFEAEGQFWVPKDRTKVCMAPGRDVPAAIYTQACQTN